MRPNPTAASRAGRRKLLHAQQQSDPRGTGYLAWMMRLRGMGEATAYIEEHAHPRLWKLLAEAALEALDFSVAEKAYVNIGDYPGIQYVKRISGLGDRMKQRAEVAAYFQRFEEAEAILREIDRKDLANELRIR